MKTVAIIPARGGSKRIPRKNIKPFRGKPIIAYSIEAALNSKIFDAVIVSTDDAEITEVSLHYGAKVPFVRSEKNSGDYATTVDVLVEVIEQYSQKFGEIIELTCCIYPTAPFITPQLLTDSFRTFQTQQNDALFPIIRFGYPIQRALSNSAGNIKMIWPENLNKRSQDLEPCYHDAGLFYWFRADVFMREREIIGTNTGAVILNETHAHDIDNEIDWKLAELKHTLLFP